MPILQWFKDRTRPSQPQGLTPPRNTDAARERNVRSTWSVLAWWFGLSSIAVIGAASTAPRWNAFLDYAADGLLLAFASASVGALLGFLFGIPRALQADVADVTMAAPSSTAAATVPPPGGGQEPADTAVSPPPALPSSARRTGLKVNTNLEQISDWLTKILVGVGLTNLRDIGPRLWQIADRAAPALGGSTHLALFCIVDFAIWGFFAAYLLTRLFLAAAFVLADDAAENVDRQEQTAFMLTQQGAHHSAAQQYSIALEQLPANVPADQRRRLFEGAIYNSLYLPPPDGFSRAIALAKSYLAQPSNPPSGRIWAFYAAALGQQYLAMTNANADAAARAAVEAAALDAVREAIKLEPAMKPLLRSLWDPNDPMRASSDENDLEVFFPNDAFATLLR